MIEDIVSLGKVNFQPLFFQDPGAKYALIIEFKTLNGELSYEKISREEISKNTLHRYMYRKGPSNQYDFTPSSRLRTPIKTLNRIIKWAKNNQHVIPGLYKALYKSKDIIKKEIENKIKGEEKPSYLVTVKIDGKYLSEILPSDFIKDQIVRRCEKYTNYSSSGYGRCAVCGKEDKLYGLTLQTIGFVFYTVDKLGFAPYFSQKNSWKQVPLCKDCSLFLEAGKEFLDNYLKINSGLGFYFYIIPSFLLKEERAVKSFVEKIKKIRKLSGDSLKKLRGLISREDSIYDLVEENSDSLRLNLLFFIEEQSRFLILTYIQNLKPSWLRRIYEAQKEIVKEDIFSEEIMSNIFGSKKKGNFFKRFKSVDNSGYIETKKGNYISWWILSLREIFPFQFQREFIDVLSSILQKRKISYRFLLRQFNIFLQDSFKRQWNLPIDALTTFSLYLFLDKLNLLKGDIMKEENGKRETIFDYEILNNERKYAFLIGALANYVVNIQAKERNCKPWEAPFRQKFNNLIIDQNRLRKIFVGCVEKLSQYRQPLPSWFPKNLAEVLNTSEKWKSSMDEISYFFTLGFVLGDSLFKEKKQINNKEGGENDGKQNSSQ